MDALTREMRDLQIREYHHLGYSNKETIQLLSSDGVTISYSHIKRLKSRLGLRRRNVNPLAIITALQEELTGSGECKGYRAMTHHLRITRGLNANPHFIRQCLHHLDPDGIESRRRHRLRRRHYSSRGPLDTIHIDGYDKLKPYGFAVHGCIDGFSRKVLWLKVGTTNNDPRVVAGYFLGWLKESKVTAAKIRMDAGTENTILAALQKACIYKVTSDEKITHRSVLIGKSVHNQRIERFWGILRTSLVQFWMDFFNSMTNEGVYAKDDDLQRECLRFCFMRLIQKELDEMVHEWNSHCLEKGHRDHITIGRPAIMYSHPQLYGANSCGVSVEEVSLEEMEEFVVYENQSGTCGELAAAFTTIMSERNQAMPTNARESLTLYAEILDSLA